MSKAEFTARAVADMAAKKEYDKVLQEQTEAFLRDNGLE